MESELPLRIVTAHNEVNKKMARLFIGNLSENTSESDLQSWLEEHGFAVESVQVIRDLNTGASRGFAFAELPRSNVKEAVDALNGEELGGSALRISEARPVLLKNGPAQQSGHPPKRRAS